MEGLRAAGVGPRADGRGDRPPAVGRSSTGGSPGWSRSASSSRPSSTAAGRCGSAGCGDGRGDRRPGGRRRRAAAGRGGRGGGRTVRGDRRGLHRDRVLRRRRARPRPAVADVFAAARSFFALPRRRQGALGDGRRRRLPAGRVGAIRGQGDVRHRSARLRPVAGRCAGFRAARRGLPGRRPRRWPPTCCAALAVALDVEPAFFADADARPAVLPADAPLPAAPGRRRRRPAQHTDYGAITLLATDGVAGLEVRPLGRRLGGRSRRRPGSLVVNLGDMLARWTNDRYVSTPHRVVPGRPTSPVLGAVLRQPRRRTRWSPASRRASTPTIRAGYEPITAGEFLQGRIDGTIPTGDGTHR